MTIFGVAGSVALLFTGLSIRSAISGIVNRQYQEIFSYNLLAVEKTGSSSKAEKKLEQKVNQLGQSEWIYCFGPTQSRSDQLYLPGNGGFVHYRNFCRAAFRQNYGPKNPGNSGGWRGDVWSSGTLVRVPGAFCWDHHYLEDVRWEKAVQDRYAGGLKAVD